MYLDQGSDDAKEVAPELNDIFSLKGFLEILEIILQCADVGILQKKVVRFALYEASVKADQVRFVFRASVQLYEGGDFVLVIFLSISGAVGL